MSSAAPAPTKNAEAAPKNGEPATTEKKPAAQLEEDDEFEDFPAEDWTEEDTQIPGGNTHLWEESWDDDDTSDEFAVQLR